MENKKAEMISRNVIIFIIYLALAAAVGFAIRAIILKFAG
jgi:hypothetical protein